MPSVSAKTLGPILHAQIDTATYLMTDEARSIPRSARLRRSRHGQPLIEEYVRGGFWHTNTVESYFSILKRGITGTFHHVCPSILKRYLAEFDFRYNERASPWVSDHERMDKVHRRHRR